MKVLSVKQPWAYLMCVKAKQEDKQAIKDVENRTWKLPEKYKNERVLIHASGKPCIYPFDQLSFAQFDSYIESMDEISFWDKHKVGYDKMSTHSKITSAIIGSVRFVDCVINHPSIWAEKSEGAIVGHSFYYKENQRPIFNWAASDPILFDKPILGVKGKLGFWEYSHPMCCPICGYPLHLQMSGDAIADAYCFNCKKDVLYYEKILCPYCGKVCLHDNSDVGVPNWGNPVHECEHCKEMILESEFNILK